ncbi:hypothetical protein [Staphylococcus pseudintermedius]|uniref:hypothetical protein n=1 Tax=Staphylococcus pseudintermedius TaxID=283734 RepID=UPI0023B18FA5|nr:hypothetical protein [Staphylococcus pseudintermedius]
MSAEWVLVMSIFALFIFVLIPRVIEKQKLKKVITVAKEIDEEVFFKTPLEKRVKLKLANKEKYDVSYHDFKQPRFIDLNQSERIHKTAIVSEYHYTKGVIKYGDWEIVVLGDINGNLKVANLYYVKIERLRVHRISWYFEKNKVENLTISSRYCFYDAEKNRVSIM